jgi:hypothetical protein
MASDVDSWSVLDTGRKGRTKFTGAQGSGDGAQKDAARLDVAARVAAEGGGGSAAKVRL